MKILVVEDNQGDQVLLKEAFAQTNTIAQLTFIDDADEALGILKQETIEVADAESTKMIILDLNLPRKSGKEFLKDIKSDKALRKIPVMVLTSSGAQNDIEDCYSAGASCYVTKPMKFDEFEAMVRSFSNFWLKEVKFAELN